LSIKFVTFTVSYDKEGLVKLKEID